MMDDGRSLIMVTSRDDYEETASHEIDGVRKEKERLTAAWTSHTFAAISPA